jgi:hypothetical protein
MDLPVTSQPPQPTETEPTRTRRQQPTAGSPATSRFKILAWRTAYVIRELMLADYNPLSLF